MTEHRGWTFREWQDAILKSRRHVAPAVTTVFLQPLLNMLISGPSNVVFSCGVAWPVTILRSPSAGAGWAFVLHRVPGVARPAVRAGEGVTKPAAICPGGPRVNRNPAPSP